MKKELIESMLSGIDYRYIEQAENVNKTKKNKGKMLIKSGIAVAAVFLVCIFTVSQKKDINNKTGNKEAVQKVDNTLKMETNERVSLTLKQSNGDKQLKKGVKVNVGKYNFGMESSVPGIRLAMTDRKNSRSTFHVTVEDGLIMVEKNGSYESINSETSIKNGMDIIWRPKNTDFKVSKVTVSLVEEKKVKNKIVINIINEGDSTYSVEYVGN